MSDLDPAPSLAKFRICSINFGQDRENCKILLLTIPTFCLKQRFLPNFVIGRSRHNQFRSLTAAVLLFGGGPEHSHGKGCKFRSFLHGHFWNLWAPMKQVLLKHFFYYILHFAYFLQSASTPPCNCGTCHVTLVIRKPILDDSGGSECHHSFLSQ